MKYWPKREKLRLTSASAPESGWVPAQVWDSGCGVCTVAGIRQFWQAVSRVKLQGRRAVSSLSSRGHLCNRAAVPTAGPLHAGSWMPCQGICTQWTLSLATDDGAHGGFCIRQTLVPPNPSLGSTHVSEGTPHPGGLCPVPSPVGAVFCVGFHESGGSEAQVAVTHINTFYSLKYYLWSTCCFAISFSFGKCFPLPFFLNTCFIYCCVCQCIFLCSSYVCILKHKWMMLVWGWAPWEAPLG